MPGLYLVHIYVSLLAPEKTDYTACHPRKTTTYTLHVVSITTHTHDKRKSIGKKEQRTNKKKKDRKEKRRKSEKETAKGKERKEKTRKARKGKTRRGSKERKREKNVILADPRN